MPAFEASRHFLSGVATPSPRGGALHNGRGTVHKKHKRRHKRHKKDLTREGLAKLLKTGHVGLRINYLQALEGPKTAIFPEFCKSLGEPFFCVFVFCLVPFVYLPRSVVQSREGGEYPGQNFCQKQEAAG